MVSPALVMNEFRAFLFAVFVVISLCTGPLVAVTGATAPIQATSAVSNSTVSSATAADATNATGIQTSSHVDDVNAPSTEDTVGYVEGYRYDDELPVDSQDDAVVDEDDLDAVVYRSMARVELLRNLTFQDDVSVDVVSREEFQTGNGDETSAEERLRQNLRYEALFMIDRETDANDEFASLLDDAVGGVYVPEQNRIVLVSDSPESPEVDEETLAHELTHALQDQHFDLQQYESETQNQDHATDGLIEGDAVWVETEYEDHCDEEWECVVPTNGETAGEEPQSALHWGLYLVLFHPYSDGPSFVEHLLEEDGWEAVNEAYDDPPTSSSEIIHPDTDTEQKTSAISVADRSTDRWQQLQDEDGPDHAEFGEAAIAAMLGYPTLDDERADLIIPTEELITGDEFDPINYDHEYTDGWAGDRLVTYVTDDRTTDESGYVWQTKWENDVAADQFLDGYLQLLAVHDTVAVEDRQNTFVIDDEFPGAYYLDHDGDTVTIVRAPSIDALGEIREGAAPEGTDTIDIETTETEQDGMGTDAEAQTPSEERSGDASDNRFGPLGDTVAVVIVALFGALLTLLMAVFVWWR